MSKCAHVWGALALPFPTSGWKVYFHSGHRQVTGVAYKGKGWASRALKQGGIVALHSDGRVILPHSK